MRKLLIGYDVGSSSVKATLLDADTGRAVASEGLPKVEMPIHAPQKDWAEQDPQMWWKYIVETTQSIVKSANVQKGDFVRLQTATLGYKIPTNLTSIGISNIRVYAQAKNLWLQKAYTGVDPEISSNGDSNLASGIERNSIPQGRSFTFGINIGL